MSAEKIIKSTQEQAVASWINYLNQLRLNELVGKLLNQDMNLENALREIQNLKESINTDVIIKNRGGTKGMHGFIGERVQVSIANAQKIIEGLKPSYSLLDDNSAIDYFRNSTPIQQKCVQSKLGLDAIREHLKKYPDFLEKGGIYQIPKDYYNKIQELIKLSPEQAEKLVKEERTLWKSIQSFLEETGIEPNQLEPMVVDYSDIQVGKVNNTLENEEASLKETDKKIRDTAYENSKPTLKEGAIATAVSTTLEGGVSFCLAIAQKLKKGKKLNKFTEEDWKEIGIKTGTDSLKGGIRGASVYVLSNFTTTPANVASALVTAVFGVISQANELHKGNITEEDFIINSETVCLDVTISTIASILGQVAIPIPVLGAIIGNVAGIFMYDIAKKYCLEKEQKCIFKYNSSITELNRQLDEEYYELIKILEEKFKVFKSAIELAFDVDINIAFNGSIELAALVGVDNSKVLKSKKDIDNYFIN